MALLEEMDLDQDGKVSLTDWEKSWEPFTEHSSDTMFFHAICAIVHGLRMPVDYDLSNPPPRHPDNNAEYVRAKISNLLQQGFAATLEFMMDTHIKVASRQLWDSDGFLPKGYKPPCPLRFLGEWLRAQKSLPPPKNEDPLSCDWSSGVPRDALTTTMKMKVAFLHLDRPQSGCACQQLLQQLVFVAGRNGTQACGTIRDYSCTPLCCVPVCSWLCTAHKECA